MIFLPACFDRKSRGEFWRFAGQTFQFYRKIGASPDEARHMAVQETNKHVHKCIKFTEGATS
jgi:hypothetical protein